LRQLVRPISAFLVPVFFVLTGMRADLRALAQPGAMALAAALTVAAVLGKQACGLGVLRRGVDRVTVGLGMLPRGEFTLIFVGVGMGLSIGGQPIVTREIYSAAVLVVLVTSLVAPPALRWSLGRAAKRDPGR
jgi:Kef-type K+ transport system membrane component KefB